MGRAACAKFDLLPTSKSVLPTVRLLSCQFFNFFVKILLINKGGAFT